MGPFSKLFFDKSSKNSHEINSEDLTKVKSNFYVILKKIVDEELDSQNMEIIEKLSDNNIMKSFYVEPKNSFRAHEPISTEKIINEEREKNLKFYSQNKNSIKDRYKGKYIVIANKDIKASSDKWDELKNESLDANHRFILKVDD